MNKFFKAIVVSSAVLLAACGARVEVPPASVGKVLTTSGYQEGVVQPSNIRLPVCMPWQACPKMVVLNMADNVVEERMTLFMPEDRLNMRFTLQASLRVKESDVDGLFNSITPEASGNTLHIPLEKIYTTYAEQIIRAEAREFLSQYSINDIASNLEAVNSQLTQKLTKSIQERTPFQVRYIGLSDLMYPDIIVKAQEAAAERTENIQQEQAQYELSKVVLERQLNEAKLQRTIEVEKALAEAEVNRIIGESITPKYVTYKQLEALIAVAGSDNKVVVPFEMLNSIAAQNMISR